MALLDIESESDASKRTARRGRSARVARREATPAQREAPAAAREATTERRLFGQFAPAVPCLLVACLALVAVAAFVWTRLHDWAEHGLDFSVYWHGGKILNDAGSGPSGLYGLTVGWAGGPELPFTYPPFAGILFGFLARMPEKTSLMLFNAAGVFLAASVAARGVRYWNAKLDWRSTFGSARNRWGAAVLFLAVLNLGPWRETLAFGQVNILLMGLMAADLLTRNQRWSHGLPGSGFLVGIAAGIKLTPLVFGLYFLMRRDWRGLLNMGAGFVFTVLVGWIVRPAESLRFWLEILPDTSRIGGAGYVDNLSIKGALLHFGVPETAVTVPWIVLSLLVVAVGAAIIKAASEQGARVVAISATALTMLLISPVSWSHHWVWMAAVLPAFAWTLREAPLRLRAIRWLTGGVLGASIIVFFFSPKTIGDALGAENLDVQTPGLWIMGASAGVFCALAIMGCWLALLRLGKFPHSARMANHGNVGVDHRRDSAPQRAKGGAGRVRPHPRGLNSTR